MDSSRAATSFYLAYDALNTDSQGRGSVVMTVVALDNAGNELGRVGHEIDILNTGGQKNTYPWVYSFGELSSPIAGWKILQQNGANNQLGLNSIYLTNIVGYPVTAPVTFTAGSALSVNVAQAVPNVPEMFLNGEHIQHTFASPVNLSQTETVTIGLGANSSLLSGLGFRLRLQPSGSTVWYPTNPAVIDLTNSVASVDITTASIPASILPSVAKMEIVFTGDVVYSGAGQIVLGPFTAAGNLTDPEVFQDLSFFYVYTEINSEGDTTYTRIIESNASAASNSITPTPTQAEGLVTLPAGPQNAASDAFGMYRVGGVFTDGIGRLLAYEKWAVSDPSGSISGNPYISWNATSHVFRDNTPDSYLLGGVTTLQAGHDPPPIGAQDVCAWQKRLCLAVADKLYVSSLSDYSSASALYFPQADLIGDPEAPIQGFYSGTGSGDPIVALLAYGTNLVIDKGPQGGIYLGFGYNVNNFALQSYLLRSGVGSVAQSCLCIVRNHAWLLGSDGWYQFNADLADPTSTAIDVLLQPSLAGKTPINAPAVKASRAVYHARRLLHFSPSAPTDTTNTVTHVFDTRQGGWTTWLIPATSGVSLSGAADTGACFLGGPDGQLYQLTGVADIASPGAVAAGIPFALSTRAVGQEGGGEDYYREKNGVRLFAEVLNEGTAAATASLGCTFDGAGYTASLPVVAGITSHLRKALPSWVKGYNLEITLSGTAAALTEVGALGIEVSEGRLL